MFYFAGDNNLDKFITMNVEQLLEGYCGGTNVVFLIDKVSNTIEQGPFEDKFTTTRMYSITRNGLSRLYGNDLFPELSEDKGDCELDTADAKILKNFIRYSKNEFPAKNYALIIGSHGGGVRIDNQNARAVVVDANSDNDWIFTAEFTDVLTAEESVDVLGFDACYMGSLEVAYQLCGIKPFKADYIVASPAAEFNDGWDYKRLIEKFSENAPTPEDFAKLLVENYKNYIIEQSIENNAQTLTCLKCSLIPEVKRALDNLSVLLVDYKTQVELIRGSMNLKQENILHYFLSNIINCWLEYPYFDLYSLAKKINENNDFTNEIKEAAKKLMEAVDSAIVCSYLDDYYKLGENDKCGLSIFFPDGSNPYGINTNGIYNYRNNQTYWYYQYWYTPLKLTNAAGNKGKCYGNLAFCADGATEGNGIVENWFELLDYWFDDDKNNYGYLP